MATGYAQTPSALAGTSGSTYISRMNIPLSPEQVAWLEAKVAAGQFDSVEEAAAAAISDSMASESDDLAWARPLVDAARASVQDGQFSSHDEFKQFLASERGKAG
jgi:antitoxin ParD1/3/4